ncbi:MAG: Sec-independent protein translocase protein TatB [Pseudomonadota bacterium]
MFDIGWAELVIIGVVALIVIGPRDLPEMFRTLGRFTAKLRSMSRDFQRAMETAAKDSGVKDVAADLRTMTSPKNLGLDAVKEAAAKFEKWDPLKPKPAAPATPAVTMPAPPVESIAAPPAPAPKPKLGPETQALADKAAARRAVAREAADKLRAINAGTTPASVTASAPLKKPGRVRTKPAVPPAAASLPAAKTARKPATSKATKDKGSA